MSKNLMEAAADILSRSKAAAPGMPMEKAKGEVQDLGGVTPTDAIPHEGEGSAKTVKKATAPGKPAAVGAMPMEKAKGEIDVVKEEKDDEDEDEKDEKDEKKSKKDDEDMNESVRQIIERAKWRSVKSVAKKITSPKSLDSDSYDYHHDNPRSTGRLRATSDKEEEGHEISQRDPAEYTTRGPRKGMVSKEHARNLKDNIRRSLYRSKGGKYVDEGVQDADSATPVIHEDVDAILSSEQNLSEEFRTKVASIYEARVIDTVSDLVEEIEVGFAEELIESVQQIEEQLVEKIDDFLGYVVEEWMEQNEVAIETGLRSELTEDFIAGLRNLFAEHYISVPEDKVELVDELAERVEQLEGELNETVARNIEMKKQLTESKKNDIIGQVCEGLTQTQTEKIRSLVEGVEFSSEGEFQKKAETIRENYFPTTVKAASAQTLTETVEQPEGQQEITDPIMKRYAAAISKSLPK